MLREILYGQTKEPVLKRALDAFADRQRAIANNIANAESEGYVPRAVEFEEKLKETMDRNSKGIAATSERHMPQHRNLGDVQHEFYFRPTGELSAGKTDVDIDKEMTDLATNMLHYEVTARKLADYFSKMRMAAKGQ